MAAYDPTIVFNRASGVLYTHQDPRSRTASRFVYIAEHVPSRRAERKTVWTFTGDFSKLIAQWNALEPKKWRFDFVGMARSNPGRRHKRSR